MPTLSNRTPEWLERQLRHSLYRFDCPSPLAIGEYELKLCPPAHQVQLAQHLVSCLDCTAELDILRTLLTSEPILAAPGVAERVRRVVLQLIWPQPGLALAGVRNAAGDPQVQIYEADDVVLTIGPGLPGAPGRASILGIFELAGQVIGEGQIALIALNGERHETTLDDLGGFEFSDLDAGMYDLHIELTDRLIVLNALTVGSR